MTYLTVHLNGDHKKKEFECGKPLLDSYLKTQAKQDVKRKLSACFILEGEKNAIKGYYTLSSASIDRSMLPEAIIKRLPASYHHLPVTLLGRLAVDSSYRGQRLGELLLLDALKRSHDVALEVGSMAVVVDPLDKDAQQFYEKYGFIVLPDSGKMFLTMDSISQLF
ncbi:GNAT family N-acetyltransferase [Chitinophaga filiformis]|uniref:GNAT family N-acetyltransferase n=1 Tax=Chitinophaga filiformis TaxID=104663 RepID=UPI001F32BF52|nr:GNAT family N-acetyltransferase [Chitinophaga filiformis]MCF6405609.1 GNAT family N-acetyltransferase [Chitinophaga filiformis]